MRSSTAGAIVGGAVLIAARGLLGCDADAGTGDPACPGSGCPPDAAVLDSGPPDGDAEDGDVAEGDAADGSGGAGPSGACSGRPHEPAGYVRISELDGSTVPPDPGGILAGDWTSWTWGGGAEGRDIVLEPSAPASPEAVFQFTFPTGLEVGSSRAVLQGWDASPAASDYPAFYEAGCFRTVGADLEVPGPGMKLLGYWGYGGFAENHIPAQLIGWIDGIGADTTGTIASRSIAFLQQGTDGASGYTSRRLDPNVDGSKRWQAGQWHQYEIEAVQNDVDTANGILRFWLDGVLTHEHTDVVYRSSTHTSGFFGRRWDPVWGGNDDSIPKTRDDRLQVDHVYLSAPSAGFRQRSTAR